MPKRDTIKLSRIDLLAFALFLLAALAFVWPLFVPGWIIPQGGGDLASFLWPTYRYAASHLTLKSLISNYQALLWNPTLYSGAPFAADNQTGLFYPPNFLAFLLFPEFPYFVLESLVAFHLFLAGAGMYLLMRFELRRLGFWNLGFGIFPAFAFMASDVFITHLGNYNIVAVSAYLPLIFLCLRQALIRTELTHSREEDGKFRAPGFTNTPNTLNLPIFLSIRWAILAGLAFGLAALAGHAQMTLILAVACLLYGLYELILQRHPGLSGRAGWRIVALGALAGLVAFGVAAIALLPALEMLRYTARAALDYAEASRWSLPPLGLAGMISPLVFGRGAHDFWPAWDRVEFGYMGVVALCLLPFARGKQTRFFWLLALAGLLIAFGQYTPVHYLLYKFIPGFASLRVPARFILLTNFAFAALAGYALASAGKHPGGIWNLGFWLLGFGICLFAPLFLDHPPAWLPAFFVLSLLIVTGLLLKFKPSLLPLLLFGELFVFGAFVEVDRADPNAGYRRGPGVDYLLAQPGPLRIDVATHKWQPDAPAVFGLESVTGISNPLALAAYDRYYWSVGYRGSPQYNFLNVQYVVADKDSPPADSTFVPVFNEDPDVDIYLNTNAMPRISLIADTIVVDSAEAAFAAIHTPTFNPAAQVVLEDPTSKNLTSKIPNPNPQPPDYSTTRLPDHPTTRLPDYSTTRLSDYSTNLFYTAYAPGHFTLVAQTPSPAYLVLAEVWYPGWVATVNGSPAAILRANTAFMAVSLPPGESTIEFQFTSPLLTLGAIISLLTILASAFIMVIIGNKSTHLFFATNITNLHKFFKFN